MDEKSLGIWRSAALAILLVLGVLVVWKPAYDYTLVKNALGFLFVSCAAVGLLNRRFSLRTPVFAVFAVWLGWNTLSALTAPVAHGAGVGLEYVLLCGIVFIAASQLRTERPWMLVWIGAAAVAAAIGIGQAIGPRKYAISTFGNPNFFAGHLLMPFFLSLGLLLRPKRETWETLLLWCAAAGFAVAIAVTQSRASIASLIAGLGLFAFLCLRGGSWRAVVRWAGLAAAVLVLAANVFIAVSYFTPAIPQALRRGMDAPGASRGTVRVLSGAYKAAVNVRSYLWRGTWNMVASSPRRTALGWGLGNFIFYYPYYRDRAYFLQPESTPVTNHPHSEYLEIWAETGAAGLVLFLAVVGLSVGGAVRAGRRTEPPPDPRQKKPGERSLRAVVLPGMICAIAAVLLDNVFSTNLRNASTAMYFWFLLGILASNDAEEPAAAGTDPSRIFFMAAAGAAFVLAVFTLVYRVVPETYLKSGINAKDDRQFEAALANYHAVVRIVPDNYVTWYKLAYVYGETGRLDRALEIYRHITEHIFPHFAKIDANLGTVYLSLLQRRQASLSREETGRYMEAARSHYRWAAWLNPYDADVLCSLASISLMHDKDAAAAAAYLRRVLTIDPRNGYAIRVLESLGKTGNHGAGGRP